MLLVVCPAIRKAQAVARPEGTRSFEGLTGGHGGSVEVVTQIRAVGASIGCRLICLASKSGDRARQTDGIVPDLSAPVARLAASSMSSHPAINAVFALKRMVAESSGGGQPTGPLGV